MNDMTGIPVTDDDKIMGRVFHRIDKSFMDFHALYEKLNSDTSHYTSTNDICTPLACVKEMVDSIPDAFWNRKGLQILDPCCGNGNFHAYIQSKVNKTADLHFNEINPKRVGILKNIFGNQINLTQEDFLEFPVEEKYDLVVANPPYAKMQNNGERASKNHSLSRLFIRKALQVIKPEGFILFIVPDNWMSFSDRNDLPMLMSQYQFHHINIHGAKRYFPKVGSSFTWFLMQKTENRKPTWIENFYGVNDNHLATIDKGANFIPLYYNEIVRGVLKKVVNPHGENVYNVLTTSDLHKTTKRELIRDTECEKFCHKLIHTPKQTVYASRPHKFQKGYKVFISLTDKYGTFIDRCGMTQSIAFIPCKSKARAEKINMELQQPVYRFINHITRYGNFNNVRVLQSLNKWGSFTLTKKERDFIDSFLLQVRK